MTTTATPGRKGKGAGLVVALALGGGLLLMTAGKKKAQAAQLPSGALPQSLPDDDDDTTALPGPAAPVTQLPIDDDDDDVPVSPGWPQPSQQPSAPVIPLPLPQQPVPIFPPAAQLPQLPQLPVNLPVPVLPTGNIPTSLPQVPVTLDQDDDDDKPPTPANVEIPPIVVPPRPPQHAAEEPSNVAEDTALMVQRLLSAEARPNWKTKDPVVLAWQKARGLVADGQYGPKTALMVADEIGTVPLVRFWPKATYPEDGHTIADFQAELITKSNSAPTPRKEQLRAAAQREQGQGYARNVKAAEALITLQAV